MHRPFLIAIHYSQKASGPVTKCPSETVGGHLDLHSAQDRLKGHAGKRFAATRPRKTKSFVLAAASLELVAGIAQLPHSIIDIEKSRPNSHQIISDPIPHKETDLSMEGLNTTTI